MAEDKAAMREERKALFDRIYGFYDVKVLAAAIDARLFEHLATEPRTDSELVELTQIPARSVRMLLISLTAMGLVTHDGRGYLATEKGNRYFVESSPHSMISAVRMADWQFDALTRMPDLIGNGAIIWDGFSHYLDNGDMSREAKRSRERQEIFNLALAGSAVGTGKVILANTDLSTSRSLLDIGGSLGVFASAVLEKYPEMQATLFDLPQVAPLAEAEFAKRGLSARTAAIGGDFVTDPWPQGVDLIAFVRVLAARTREENVELLRKAHHTLPSGGRVLFYEEHVLPSDPSVAPRAAAWAAIFIAMASRGEVRRIDDWTGMFEEAGFSDVKSVLGSPWGIVTGTKR